MYIHNQDRRYKYSERWKSFLDGLSHFELACTTLEISDKHLTNIPFTSKPEVNGQCGTSTRVCCIVPTCRAFCLTERRLIGNYINTSANGKSHVDSRAVRLLSHMSALVLFLYDSIVTLCEEIDIIWRRKWTAMTWLFAFTRYVAIVDIILTFTSPGSAQVRSSQQTYFHELTPSTGTEVLFNIITPSI